MADGNRFHPDTSNIHPEAYKFNKYHQVVANNCCEGKFGVYELSDEVSVCLRCYTAYSDNYKLVMQGNKNRLNGGTEAALKHLEYGREVECGIDDPPTREELDLLHDLRTRLGPIEGAAWFFKRQRYAPEHDH